MSRRALDDDQIAWAYERWQEGYTWTEIAKALYVTDMTIKNSVYRVYGHQNHRRTREPLVYHGKETR